MVTMRAGVNPTLGPTPTPIRPSVKLVGVELMVVAICSGIFRGPGKSGENVTGKMQSRPETPPTIGEPVLQPVPVREPTAYSGLPPSEFGTVMLLMVSVPVTCRIRFCEFEVEPTAVFGKLGWKSTSRTVVLIKSAT